MKIATIVMSIVLAGAFAQANSPETTTPAATEAVHADSIANHAEANVKDAKAKSKAAKKHAKKAAKAAKAEEKNDEAAQ